MCFYYASTLTLLFVFDNSPLNSNSSVGDHTTYRDDICAVLVVVDFILLSSFFTVPNMYYGITATLSAALCYLTTISHGNTGKLEGYRTALLVVSLVRLTLYVQKIFSSKCEKRCRGETALPLEEEEQLTDVILLHWYKSYFYLRSFSRWWMPLQYFGSDMCKRGVRDSQIFIYYIKAVTKETVGEISWQIIRLSLTSLWTPQ